MGQLNFSIVKRKDGMSFEEKVTHFSFLIAIIMTIAAFILDYIVGGLIIYDLIFLIVWIASFYLHDRFRWVLPAAFGFLIAVVYPIYWITSNGSLGSLPYYSLFFVAVICIVSKGISRKILVGSLMVIQLLLILRDYYTLEASTNYIYVFLAIHLTFLTIGIVILLTSYSNTYANEKEQNLAYSRAIEEQNQYQLYCVNNLGDLNNKLRSDRHDFNNHLNVIYGLMNNKEYDKTMAYTTQLVDTLEEYKTIVTLPYPTLSVMLNYKLALASNENIKLKLDIDLPSGLKINEFDYSILFGNLIDNAIEALRKVKSEERYIELSIYYKPDYFVIISKNPYAGDLVLKNETYMSTKCDDEKHGYGIHNIKRIVDKYFGLCSFKHEHHIFTVDIALLVS